MRRRSRRRPSTTPTTNKTNAYDNDSRSQRRVLHLVDPDPALLLVEAISEFGRQYPGLFAQWVLDELRRSRGVA